MPSCSGIAISGAAHRSLRFASLPLARSLVRIISSRSSFLTFVLFISSSRKQLDFEGGDPFGDGYEDDDDDGDDEAGGGAAARHYGAEHVLLLFDCDASMFERYVSCRRSSSSSSSSTNDDDDYVEEEGYFTGGKIGDGDENDDDDDRRRMNRGLVRYSPMDVAATAAHRLLRAKVRDVAETKAGKRDGVGVLLYGCDPDRRRRLRRRRGDGGGGRDDDGVEIVVVVDDDDDDGGDEDPLPTTHELVELTAPGIEQVLTVQECLPDEDEDEGEDDDRGLRGRRRRRRGRDLRGEFSSVPRRRRKGGDDGGGGDGEGEGVEEEDDTLAVCGLLRGLTAALKIFASAK